MSFEISKRIHRGILGVWKKYSKLTPLSEKSLVTAC